MRCPVTRAAASPRSSAERSSSRAASCATASSPRWKWTHESPVQGREELRDVAQLAAQLASPGVGAARLRRREALRGDRRLAQRELQAELAPLTLGPVGQARQHLQPPGQLRDRLGHRGARERPLPGPLPVVDRLLGEPRLGAVPGEQLGLRVRRLREALLQHPGDAGVQLAAAAP